MAVMIANLRSLRGMGILADRNAKAASLQFRKFNLIYGFNGSGKSTISRIFASLESGELHPRLPAASSFEVSMDDDAIFGCPDKLKGLERRLLVFNSDFQDKNFQWSLGRANPVFFIGADQADAANNLERLEREIPQLNGREVIAIDAVKLAERSLSAFKRDRAKITARLLHLGNRKYEAPQLTADFEAWVNEPLVSLEGEELRAAEDTRKLEEPMPALSPIEFDVSSISRAFKFVIEMCGQSLSDVALDEVKRFPDMLLWIKQGHEFHEANALNDCLLCGNTFSVERRAQLKGVLDNQIDEFVAKLDRTAERLKVVIDGLESLEFAIPESDAISTELRLSFRSQRSDLVEKIRISKTHLIELREVLDSKRIRPATPADISNLLSVSDLEDVVTELGSDLESINAAVKQHNELVSDFEKHRENAGVSIRRHFIAECREDFTSHIFELTSAQGALVKVSEELQSAKAQAERLRIQIKTHGPAASVINQLIASYLGHSELTISPVDEGYEIHRHGRSIEGLPSEGEKTAIAISYFLSTIESEERKLKDMIVVIDDPVSSLDSKALNYACALIRSRLSGACQLFILTHNQQCMNEFRKAWKGKTKAAEGVEPTATFLFMDVVVPVGETKRTSSPVQMSKLLREYDSEYHYLVYHMLRFVDVGDDHYDYGYMMPNVLRRVLDVFLAFKCPGNSGLTNKIEQICNQYADLDRDRLRALERLSQVESHSDNLDDLISFSSMTLEETRTAASSLLAMMECVDVKHVQGLRGICR